MLFVRDDLPARQLHGLTPPHFESLVIEISFEKESKWILPLVYKPPPVNNGTFCNELSILLDKCLLKTSNILLGDLNQDLLKPDTHGRALTDVCDVFDMHCLIKEPTCFKDTPSLLDVMLTTQPQTFTNSGTLETGLSDFHKCTFTVKKGPLPPRKPEFIVYRSYKNFREENFLRDLAAAPLHVSEVFDDVNDCCWVFTQLQMDVMNDHAPFKKKKLRKSEVPFMKKKLRKSEVPFMSGIYRKAIFKKSQLKNRYNSCRNSVNWELYRKQRNLCTALRRKAVNHYFKERCSGGAKNKDLYTTLKPFLSKKNSDKSGIIKKWYHFIGK
jgi:hypothetical protein